MPYSANVYTLPPGTAPTTLTPIDSSDYTAFIDDIEAAQNAKRPVVAGGTGGDSVITGWDGLAKKGTDIATASSINLTTATGPSLTLTGTTTVTAVTLAEGSFRLVRAAGAFQITASASLLCNGSSSVNMSVVAEDLLVFRGGASSVVSVAKIGGTSAATTSSQGIVELATVAEALAGTDAVRAVTPAGLYFPTGHLFGLTLSNNASDATNDIDIAAGTCRDSSDTQNISGTAMTKQLDANWAAGTAAGGRYSGAAIANTTYHVWAVAKALGASPDYYFDPSAVPATVLGHLQAETGGSAYLYVRRIGSIVRVSGAIKAFTQYGRRFEWVTPPEDVNVTNSTTTSSLRTMTVPLGLKLPIRFHASQSKNSATTGHLFSSPDQTDTAADAPSATAAGRLMLAGSSAHNSIDAAAFDLTTNTSGQIRSVATASASNLAMYTIGWTDEAGRT